MYDMLPFPKVTGTTDTERINELYNYLIQFKETLEFALTNITKENLSPDLENTLLELQKNIKKSNDAREEEVMQLSANAPTVSAVCSSDLFKEAVKNEVSKYLNINNEEEI